MASLPRWQFGTLSPVATTPTATAAEDEEGGARGPSKERNEKKEVFEEAHELLGNVLLILASLHTLAALKHQFIDRDELLRRMLPRRDADETADDIADAGEERGESPDTPRLVEVFDRRVCPEGAAVW